MRLSAVAAMLLQAMAIPVAAFYKNKATFWVSNSYSPAVTSRLLSSLDFSPSEPSTSPALAAFLSPSSEPSSSHALATHALTDTFHPISFLHTSLPALTPYQEEDLLTNLAHLSLDVATIFVKGPLTIRLWVFCGRLFSLGSDWVADHNVKPGELAFQLTMLTFSSVLFVASLIPALRVVFDRPSPTTLKVYSQFKPSLTYSEFAELLRLTSSEVSYAPRAVVLNSYANSDDNDRLVLLIEGSLEIVGQDNRVIAGEVLPSKSAGFVGDVSFLERLYVSQRRRRRRRPLSPPLPSPAISPSATVLSGPSGSRCVVFSGPELRRLMDGNDRYDVAVRAVLTLGLQRKLREMMLDPGGKV